MLRLVVDAQKMSICIPLHSRCCNWRFDKLRLSFDWRWDGAIPTPVTFTHSVLSDLV